MKGLIRKNKKLMNLIVIIQILLPEKNLVIFRELLILLVNFVTNIM